MTPGTRSVVRSPRGVVRLLLVVALLAPAFLGASRASHHVLAEEEEGSLAGRPLNFGGLTVPTRPFISDGAELSLERLYVDFGLMPDPFLSAAGSSGQETATRNQQVPFRNPAPAFSRNLLISRNFGYSPFQTEPTLAVDPTDPDHLIMGTIDYNMGSLMSVYVSFDAGETWDDISGAGDPVVAFDRDGNAYICMLSIGVREFVIGTIASEIAILNLAVSKSTDGGLTWSDATLTTEGSVTTVSNVDQAGKERGTITIVDLDKPWFTTGPSPTDPDKDILYMSYTEFEQTYTILYADELAFLSEPILATTIKVVSSADGGQTWSEPVAVSPKVYYGFNLVPPGQSAAQQQPAEGSFAARVVQGSQIKVLPDGTLAAAWYDSTDDGTDTGLATLGFATSSDQGTTFSEPVVAGYYREAPFRLRTATFRYGALPAMAVGPEGEIYILQAGRPVENPADDSDIYLYRSLDQGATFDPPIKVNQDDSGKNQFFPAIEVSSDGIVHVMWGDQRDDPIGLRYNIYYTQSADKGETWGFTISEQNFTAPDTRVTDFSSNPMKGFPGGRFIGDYMSIAATEEDVFLVWPDTRLGEFGGYNQQIGFARKTAIEPPSLFLSPPSGSAGRIVDIQGFGFQADSAIQLYVSGVITAQLRTDTKGQFTTSIYMPLTGEGPTEIRAFDETGNIATASFFTEFGFDTLQRSLDQIAAELGATPQAAVASPVAVEATPEAVVDAGQQQQGGGAPGGQQGPAAPTPTPTPGT
jgi:hypothetical protein